MDTGGVQIDANTNDEIEFNSHENDVDVLMWDSNGSESFTMQGSNGYIGINDNTPSYQLDVSGDIRIYGSTKNLRITNTSETNAGIIFEDAQAPGSQYAKILFDSGSGNELKFYLNSATHKFEMQTDGDFHADGDVIAYSTTTSDIRLKKNIEPLKGSLDKITSLSGKSFE